MDILTFILYYIICTLVLFLIAFMIIKIIIKKKCFSLSKYAEKEIDNYFHAYDNNLDSLLNDLKGEGDSDDDSVNW